MKALYIMSEDMMPLVTDTATKKKIAELLGDEPAFATYKQVRENPELIRDVQYLFPSYGMECMDEEFMRAAKSLEAVFFLGGSVKGITSESFWQRNIPITCAAAANAVPVAEFVLGQILLYLKGFFFHSENYKKNHDFRIYPVKGVFHKRIGLISYGSIAKHLRMLLKSFDVEVAVYSPELNAATAAAEGMTYMSTDELFASCDVVSLHAPLLPATTNMIKYEHIVSMQKNTAFINTARGAVVDEAGMIAALKQRSDITAFIDVTQQEPIAENSELYNLPNVILTPHIAGATGEEKARLGYMIVDELKRYLHGQPMRYTVEKSSLDTIA